MHSDSNCKLAGSFFFLEEKMEKAGTTACECSQVCTPMHACYCTSGSLRVPVSGKVSRREWEAAVAMATVRLA